MDRDPLFQPPASENRRTIIVTALVSSIMKSSAEKQLRALEQRIERYQRRLSGRPCAHCEEGWVREESGALRCDGCGYLRYL